MSGVKRISVDANAWSQAQQAAARLRQVNREIPSMLDAVRRENQAAIDRAATETRARQDALDRALTGLSQQTKKIEAQTRQRIRAQEERLRGELRDATGKLRQETRAALEDQERRFADGLARERQERARETSELRDELSGIQADKDRARAVAAAYAADARLMRDAIDRELPHERFAPGRLAELSRRLDNAEENAGRGLGEAALAQAQELYLQLSELRAEVELREQEWQAVRLAAGEAVTLLQQQITVNTSPAVLDENGDTIDDCTLDVDFWSEGELGRLTEETGKLAARLADAGNPPSVAELREIAEHAAAGGELDTRLTGIVTTAQARQIASQVRVNLAELVVNTLEETAGYSWEGEALYAGKDERRAFYSKLRHLDSSEIVVEVAPDEDGKSCTLRILSYENELHDEEERVHRADAIADTLRANGLQAGLPAADMEKADPALADFKKLALPVAPGRARQVGAAAGVGSERV